MYDNYIEYEDDYESNNYQVRNFNIKKYFKYIIIFFVILIGFFVYRYFTSYKSYENKMVSEAKEYVKNNHITSNQEIYLDVMKLNVEVPSNCSLASGVIYDGFNYKPLLSCNDYESNITFNSMEGITLLGSPVIVLLKGMEFNDPGYISSHEIVTSGNVGTEAGVYNINYFIDNKNITRKVIIIDNSILLREFPVLTLNGEKELILDINSAYQDAGVQALDNVDGDITSNVKVTSFVDTKNIGEYNVLYEIINSRGYKRSIIRKVVVAGDDASSIISGLSTYGLTNKNVKIIFNILGNNYSNTLLPNNEKTTQKNFEYEVKENGTYDFKINDVFGNTILRKVDVMNIDKENPNGSCHALLYNNHTDITTTTPSDKIISKYYYIIDGVSNESISNTFRTDKVNPKIISVKIKDSVGNENIFVCKKEEKKSNIPETGITRIIEAEPLKKPIGDTLAKKSLTINDLNLCIYNKVQEAGPGTRYGVVAAAIGLLDCTKEMTGYTISYDHTAGKVETEKDGINYCTFNSDICGKLGVNSRWGKPGGSCTNGEDSSNKQCYYGLNCANFVHWALCNGGMDMCTKGSPGATTMSSKKYFPEADSFKIYKRRVTYLYGTDLTAYGADALVRMMKPGDLIHSYEEDNYVKTDHIMIVTGVDDSGVYIAENGRKTRKIAYSSFVDGRKTYQIVLLENYYNNPNNQNNLYN